MFSFCKYFMQDRYFSVLTFWGWAFVILFGCIKSLKNKKNVPLVHTPLCWPFCPLSCWDSLAQCHSGELLASMMDPFGSREPSLNSDALPHEEGSITFSPLYTLDTDTLRDSLRQVLQDRYSAVSHK